MHIAANMQLAVDEIKKSKKERLEYRKTRLSGEQERKRVFQKDSHSARVLWQSLTKPGKHKKKKKNKER